MKKILMINTVVFLLIIFCSANIYAQGPEGKDFGFGIILGDPTGGTLKLYTSNDNALVFNFGPSYFGSLRLGVDYLWHFNAFESQIAELYAGAGGVLGLGDGKGLYYKDKFIREERNAGFGARGIFGLNIIPGDVPLEFFFEFGVLLALAPDVGSAVDVGAGMRFYP